MAATDRGEGGEGGGDDETHGLLTPAPTFAEANTGSLPPYDRLLSNYSAPSSTAAAPPLARVGVRQASNPPAEPRIVPGLADYPHSDDEIERREHERTAYGADARRSWKGRVLHALGSSLAATGRHAKKGAQSLLKTAGHYRRAMLVGAPGQARMHINALIVNRGLSLEKICRDVLRISDPLDLFRPNIDFRLAGAYIDNEHATTLASHTSAPYYRLPKADLDYFFFVLRPSYALLRDYARFGSFVHMLETGMTPAHFSAIGLDFAALIEPSGDSPAGAPLLTLDILQGEYMWQSDPTSPTRTIPRRWDVDDWIGTKDARGMHMRPHDLVRLKELCPHQTLVGNLDYMHTFGIHSIAFAVAFGLIRRGQALDTIEPRRQAMLVAAGLLVDEIDPRPRTKTTAHQPATAGTTTIAHAAAPITSAHVPVIRGPPLSS